MLEIETSVERPRKISFCQTVTSSQTGGGAYFIAMLVKVTKSLLK